MITVKTNSVLTLELETVPPAPAPTSGCEWDDSHDYPGVRAVISLPCEAGYSHLRNDLISDVVVAGEHVGPGWGDHASGQRCKDRTFRGATLAAAEAEAIAWHAEAAAAIAPVLARREARLARREATIAQAYASPGRYCAAPESEAKS